MAAANEKTLRESFREFDTDNSGSIDLKELKCVIKRYFKLAKKKANDKQITAIATVSTRKLIICTFIWLLLPAAVDRWKQYNDTIGLQSTIDLDNTA